ncbi:hypothetical protein [Methylorubrum rhodinum]|uniref:hypothetical protein n=1 Tax=Methylorubrum rhodinum TaxID=29428 RepID=UPI003BAE2CC6
MGTKRHKPEDVVAKLRQADVLIAQGQSVADVIRVPDLWNAIRQALAYFTAEDCRNSLTAAGYETDLAVAT